MKTVRFAHIVTACGRPEIHLTWTKPERDAELMKALKQTRVMTLHQTVRGTTKDYGTIGLLADAHAQILIFPRSLKKFSDRRVVGIDYSALGDPAAKAAPSPHAHVTVRRAPKRKPSLTSSNDPDKIEHFPTSRPHEKPTPPPPPKAPVAWKEITSEVSRIKALFKARDYAKAADAFQEIADTLRNE